MRTRTRIGERCDFAAHREAVTVSRNSCFAGPHSCVALGYFVLLYEPSGQQPTQHRVRQVVLVPPFETRTQPKHIRNRRVPKSIGMRLHQSQDSYLNLC